MTIQVIDSHTGGEPTRTVIGGFPDLGGGPVAGQMKVLRSQHDAWRKAVLLEPRGHDVLVGALLCPPADRDCVAGVIFFNNVGYLGMCGHGLIGVIATLVHQGRIQPGLHAIETPAGIVQARLHDDGRVSVRNVTAYRAAKQVPLQVPGLGAVHGDIAWGGNWFLLVKDFDEPLSPTRIIELTHLAQRLRKAANEQGFPEVDHVELFGPPVNAENHSRNFVLCPGGAYDRSPCGTGTSAKLACLAVDGELAPGEIWRQESIIGSVFEGSYEPCPGGITPTITGRAFITAEAQLVLEPEDPFAWGIP